jgi:glycosyltransferase involved in cell wall biosynthesis
MPMLVSIVTPVFNQESFIAQTIESVLAQDYPHIEYIVIDDGSTDGTPDVIASYAGKFITVRHSNMGQARTLNKGWAKCRGQVLGYLSADDVLLPNAVSQAVALLDSEPDVVMVYPDCDLIDPFSQIIRHSVGRETIYEELVVKQECYIGPGAFFRRSAYEQAGGWDEQLRVAPDREFWMRLGLLGKITMIPQVLAHYRMHPQSISYFHSTVEDSLEYVAVMEKYFGRRDLPAYILAKRDEAFCWAYVVGARIHVRGGRFLTALRWIKIAQSLYRLLVFPVYIMMLRTLLGRHCWRGMWMLKNLVTRQRRVNSTL